MALITCNECGRMVSDKAEMCPNCGNNIKLQLTLQVKDKPTSKSPVRHGFVTFWLSLEMIGSLLAAAGTFFLTEELYGEIYGYIDADTIKWLGIAYLGSAIACWNIYKWKKKGFWMLLLWSVTSVISWMAIEDTIAYGDIISVLILWGILQIPTKESGSCWSNLK